MTIQPEHDGAEDTAVNDCVQEGLSLVDKEFEAWDDAQAVRRVAERIGADPLATDRLVGLVARDPFQDSAIETSRNLEAAIGAFAEASEALRDAIAVCDTHHREKPGIKLAAIRRLMQETNPATGKAHSASSAEAVVEMDATYAAYLERGTSYMLVRMHLETALQIAEARMTFIARRTRSDF